MRRINTHIKYTIIVFGLIAVFLFAFLNSNLKSTETKQSADASKAQLQNKNIENCNITQIEIDRNQKSNNSAVLEEKNNKNFICYSTLKINSSRLLSPRVYTGLLEPKSFLISNFGPLKASIKNYLKEQNISASVYVENLRNGANMGIAEYRGYFPASLNKLPVAILILQKIEDGKLSFNSILPIEDSDRTDTSGSLSSTTEAELPIRTLLEKLLQDSDNTAFNVLLRYVDRKKMERLLKYYDININVDYPYQRVEFQNQTNLVTPISMYNLFSSLYLSTALSDPKDSEFILSELINTTFDIKSIANLPDNVIVSHKYGEYYIDDAKLFHDCGIMYFDRSRFFYCIMTNEIQNEDYAKESIGHVVNSIYNYIVDTRTELAIYKNQTIY